MSRSTRAHGSVSRSDPEQPREVQVLADGDRQRREREFPDSVVAREVAAIGDLPDDDLMRLAQWGRKDHEREAWGAVNAQARRAGTLDIFAAVHRLTSERARRARLMWWERRRAAKVAARAMVALSVRRNVAPEDFRVLYAPWKELRDPEPPVAAVCVQCGNEYDEGCTELSCSTCGGPLRWPDDSVTGASLPAAAASPSCLLYLFGDRVAKEVTDKWKPWGEAVPCSQTPIDTFELSKYLFASALWNLRTRRLIDLELAPSQTPRQRLRRRAPEVLLRVRQTQPTVGLEGRALAHLSPGDRIDVTSQIERSIGAPSFDAVTRVFATVWEEAAARGLFKSGAFEPICDRIADLEPAFLDTVRRWNRFVADEPELSSALLHACFTAVASRQNLYMSQTTSYGG